MKLIGLTRAVVLLIPFILVGCKTTSEATSRPAAVSAPVPPAESYDFMGCRLDALGCDSDCTKKAGVTLDAPDICPKGSFEGHLACFCEKEVTR